MKSYKPQFDANGFLVKTYTVMHTTFNIELYEPEIIDQIGADYLGTTVYNDNEYTFHFRTEIASIHFSRKILY